LRTTPGTKICRSVNYFISFYSQDDILFSQGGDPDEPQNVIIAVPEIVCYRDVPAQVRTHTTRVTHL
jgi:hypothetical protein